jgi:hypothetical protein
MPYFWPKRKEFVLFIKYNKGVLLEKMIISQTIKNFPTRYETRRIITMVITAHQRTYRQPVEQSSHPNNLIP